MYWGFSKSKVKGLLTPLIFKLILISFLIVFTQILVISSLMYSIF